jgi:uncharacterized protein
VKARTEPGARAPRRVEALRTCIGCRRVAETGALLRVTRTAGGDLVVGTGHPGRGAWLCRHSIACLDAAARRGAFARALRAPVQPDALERLRTLVMMGVPMGKAAAQVCEDGEPGRATDSSSHAGGQHHHEGQ